ncbi:MAG TPA: pseudaminic acid cytidylyltransferase [Vicinamibacterales bacterium]|nr:pseudaminic acid cytidylyltransferase [Vicinamibacterales bacterium]
MTVAIVTARGGSKRIPGKNIRDFLGRPMMAYPIAAARDSGLFDHIIVSTDDDGIAEVARRLGAEVPFKRPAELSDDAATTDAVLLHAIGECQARFGPTAAACCLYPTSPFLTARELRRGLDLLRQHGATSAFPVVRYDFPLEHALTLVDGVRPRPRWPESIMKASQDLPEYVHDAGMFYWCDVAKFVQTPQLFGDDAVAFVVDADRCQDINTEEDWRRAEMKYRLLAAAE